MIEIHCDIIVDRQIDVEVFRVAHMGGEPYEGEYEVTPDFDGTTLETSGKTLSNDVTVHPITVSRTSNPSGGNTVYIGGVISG